MEADEVIALCGQVEKWTPDHHVSFNRRSCHYKNIEGRIGDIELNARFLIRPREPYGFIRLHITVSRDKKEVGELVQDYAPGVTPYFKGPFSKQVELALGECYQLAYIDSL